MKILFLIKHSKIGQGFTRPLDKRMSKITGKSQVFVFDFLCDSTANNNVINYVQYRVFPTPSYIINCNSNDL